MSHKDHKDVGKYGFCEDCFRASIEVYKSIPYNAKREDREFPDWYTIDSDGLDSLCKFLRQSFEGKTVRIHVEEETDAT